MATANQYEVAASYYSSLNRNPAMGICRCSLASELDQGEDSVGKPRNSAVSWSSDIDLSPNALDSPVVVSEGIGVE
eukprot:scaffold60167_cov21-Cyclotella_meneghiniana.AAC.1